MTSGYICSLKETHLSKKKFKQNCFFYLKDRSDHVDFKMYRKDVVKGLITYSEPVI